MEFPRLVRAVRLKSMPALAIATIAIVIAAGAAVIQVATSSGSSGTVYHLYNVTFSEMSYAESEKSGSIRQGDSQSFSYTVNQQNLTWFRVNISWHDESSSPINDPNVQAQINPPPWENAQGGRLASSSWNPPPGGGWHKVFINVLPENTTIPASSPQSAITIATANQTNATAGTGDWTVSINVGSVPLGRVRPSGSIAYTLQVEYYYFEAKAVRID